MMQDGFAHAVCDLLVFFNPTSLERFLRIKEEDIPILRTQSSIIFLGGQNVKVLKYPLELMACCCAVISGNGKARDQIEE